MRYISGQLIAKFVPDYPTNPQKAVEVAGEIALCCGIILTVIGLLNMGNLIKFISFPVMSGFTSGAACAIGLSQLKGALGFDAGISTVRNIYTVPQQGAVVSLLSPGHRENMILFVIFTFIINNIFKSVF